MIAQHVITHPAIAHQMIVVHVIAHPAIAHRVIVYREIVAHVIAPPTTAHCVITSIACHTIAICHTIILAVDHQFEEVYLKDLIITHLQFKVIQEELSKNRKVGDQTMTLVMIIWTKTEHHLVVDIRVLNGIPDGIIHGVHNTVH